MGFKRTSGVGDRQIAALVASICCVALSAAPVSAGEWRVTPAVSASSSFSDNINSATDREDRNSEILHSLAPSIGIFGQGGRVSLNLAYSHERFFTHNEATDESATNSLLANGQAEIYDRVAFLEFSSSISRQVVDPTQPVSSLDTGTEGNNRTTVRSVSLQPFFLHHFGTWLETESRYIYDHTDTKSGDIEKTRSLGESFAFNSGRRFSVFTFSGELSSDKTIRDGGAPRTIETTAETNYRLRVTPRFSLLAGAGWQNIDDPSVDENLKGFTWSYGFAVQPNSRSSMELTYGREFNTDTFDFSAQYALSSRTSISASYSDTFTTSEQLLSDSLTNFVDDGTGTLVNPQTGEVFDPTNPNFAFQNTLFRQQLFTASLTMSRRRTNYTAGLEIERREDGASGVLARVSSLSFSVSRALSPRLNALVTGSAVLDDSGNENDREDKRFSASASLTYQLMKNTNASLTYRSNVTKSTLGENNFHDNVLTLSLGHTF